MVVSTLRSLRETKEKSVSVNGLEKCETSPKLRKGTMWARPKSTRDRSKTISSPNLSCSGSTGSRDRKAKMLF
eukprot:Pgem_evm1s17280